MPFDLVAERARLTEVLQRESGLPMYMHGGLVRFIVDGILPGNFLMRILENDLKGAAANADDNNKFLLFQYASFLYNNAPVGCYGSPEAVAAWHNHHGLEFRTDVEPSGASTPQSEG